MPADRRVTRGTKAHCRAAMLLGLCRRSYAFVCVCVRRSILFLCFRDDLNAFVCVCVRFRGFHIKFDAFRYVRHAFSVFWLISALNLMRFCAFLYFFIVFAMI